LKNKNVEDLRIKSGSFFHSTGLANAWFPNFLSDFLTMKSASDEDCSPHLNRRDK